MVAYLLEVLKIGTMSMKIIFLLVLILLMYYLLLKSFWFRGCTLYP